MKEDILSSWKENALEWNSTIDSQSIISRKYTNKAILETIFECNLQKVADLGCLEGWLCREMTKNQIKATGFDGTVELIELAQKKGDEAYYLKTFEQIINGESLKNAPFDGAVFNFTLYLKDDLNILFEKVLGNLKNNGVLLIQTLHPFFLLSKGLSYKSQWLSDSWQGLSGNFKDAHSWYARTFKDWIDLIAQIPSTTFELKEVLDDKEQPISLILILKKQDG